MDFISPECDDWEQNLISRSVILQNVPTWHQSSPYRWQLFFFSPPLGFTEAQSWVAFRNSGHTWIASCLRGEVSCSRSLWSVFAADTSFPAACHSVCLIVSAERRAVEKGKNSLKVKCQKRYIRSYIACHLLYILLWIWCLRNKNARMFNLASAGTTRHLLWLQAALITLGANWHHWGAKIEALLVTTGIGSRRQVSGREEKLTLLFRRLRTEVIWTWTFIYIAVVFAVTLFWEWSFQPISFTLGWNYHTCSITWFYPLFYQHNLEKTTKCHFIDMFAVCIHVCSFYNLL